MNIRQALLDLYTLQEKLGSVEGKNITILGDILFSRVARSNFWVYLRWVQMLLLLDFYISAKAI